MAVFAALVVSVPGFGALEYYFTLAMSGPIALASLWVGAEAGARTQRLGFGAWGRAIAGSTMLSGVALAVVSAASLWVPNCRPALGLLFFALGPLCSGWVAASVGTALGLVVRRAGWATALGALAVLVSVARHLVVFFTSPRIFFFDPFFGFWSGALYDEVIRVSATYWWFRLSCAADALAWVLIAAAWRARPLIAGRHRRWALPTAAVAGGLAAIALNLAGGPLGWSPSRAIVLSELDARYDTAHCTLHYPSGSAWLTRWAPLLAEDCEFRLAQLTERFGDPPPGRVSMYWYRSRAQQRRLMGADRVYIAKPWTGEAHLSPLPYGHRTIGHELAHLYVAQYADGPLRVPAQWGLLPHMGLVEGLATATEAHRGRLTLHQWSAALLEQDKLPDMAAVMGPRGYFAVFGPTAYTTAGSLLTWVADTRGVSALVALYGGAPWEQAVGVPLATSVSEWKAFLSDRAQVPLGDGELERARFRYDRKAVFARTCPLAVAATEVDASVARRRGRDADAVALRARVAGWRGGEHGKRLALARELAMSGRFEEAEREADALLQSDQLGAVSRARVAELRADLRWRLGDEAEAAAGYAAIDPAAVEWEDERRLAVKRLALSADADAVRAVVRDYLTDGPPLDEPDTSSARGGDGDDDKDAPDPWLTRLARVHLQHPDAGVIAYLVGLRVAAERGPIAAVVPLSWALQATTLEAPSLRAEAHFRLGQAWFFVGDAERSRAHMNATRQLLPPTALGLVSEVDDWLARVRWWEQDTTR